MLVTASMVKELRERTGSGMMECKKALTETNGDMESAIEHMRKSGQAKADKKAGRIAAEGLIESIVSDEGKVAVILEVNCETDFVAKDASFQSFVHKVAECILSQRPEDVHALSGLTLSGDRNQEVEAARQALVTKIGENIQIRRFEIMHSKTGSIASYQHGSRIGVLVDIDKADQKFLGKDVAMHIAASRPVCVSEAEVPGELIEKEREIFKAQAQQSGKPADIVEKMVQGRMKKYLAEVTLTGQPFVKDPDKTVGKLLNENGANVISFCRFEVGEGIEKRSENFADEVMAQVKGV